MTWWPLGSILAVPSMLSPDRRPSSRFRRVPLIHFSPRVSDALAQQQPIVALESSVLAQGLPIPANADAARRMVGAVERVGAVPAISAVVAGKATFGLEDEDLARFLARDGVMKVSARDIPVAMLTGRDGATTVAG